MTLTKADIVARVYAQGMLTKSEACASVERSLDIIKDTLASGQDVLISGFGKWSVRQKAQRRGRNPQTGNPLLLSPRKVVTFKPSRVLKGGIQGEEGPAPSGQEPDPGDKDPSRVLRPGYF